MNIPIHLLITVGIPALISLVCLLGGYGGDPNSVPLLILGWGAFFLTIGVGYLEWYVHQLRSVFRTDTSYEIAQRKTTPVLHQVEGIVLSAQEGEEIFATATFPLSQDYEQKLVAKVLALASAAKNGAQTVFTRVISNSNDAAMQTWLNKMKSSTDSLYSQLHPLIQSGQVKIYWTDHPVGLDILMVAGARRKTVLLGIKEEPPDLYLNGFHGQFISRGTTFIFEDDAVADSIYNYYAKFICTYLERQGRRLTV